MTDTKDKAMTPITMQDVRLIAGEGKLSAHDVLAAVNAHLRLHPTPPAPQAGEIERVPTEAEYEAAWRRILVGPLTLPDAEKVLRIAGLNGLFDHLRVSALRSAQAPAVLAEIEQRLKNAGLTSRDGTFVSAPTREIVAALRSATAEDCCATCRDDPVECAKIPLRHCEKLQRDSEAPAPHELRATLAKMKAAKEQLVNMNVWASDIKAVEDAIETIEAIRAMKTVN